MFYDYLTLIGHAALMTLGLAICSLIVGLLLSIIFTALEANKYVFIAKPASIVIALLRGLPEILVVLLIYFGSTQVVEMLTGEYIEFSAFGCGVFALSLIFCLLCFTNLTWCDPSYSKRTVGIRCSIRIKPTLYFHSFDYAASMATRFTRLKQSMARVIKRYGIGVINWC